MKNRKLYLFQLMVFPSGPGLANSMILKQMSQPGGAFRLEFPFHAPGQPHKVSHGNHRGNSTSFN